MRSGLLQVALCLGPVALSSCAGLSKIQGSVTQFNQSAHAIDLQETAFLQDIRSADCANQFYEADAAYAYGRGPLPSINGSCQPTILTDQQIAIRQGALDAISVYADKIQTLAQGTNASLDASAETLASNLNKRLPSAAGGIAGEVETAIIELANIALDNARFHDIKSAAVAAQPPLEKVVSDLKTENTLFAMGLDSKLGGIETSMTTAAKERRGSSTYFDVITARNNVISSNPFPPTPGSTQTGAAEQAQKLNAALDALAAANNALATADNGTILARVNDLVARVKDAQAIYSKLSGK